MKKLAFLSINSILLMLFSACASQVSPLDNLSEEKSYTLSAENKLTGNINSLNYIKGHGTIKTTKQDCIRRRGKFTNFYDLLPGDMVTCLLPEQERSIEGDIVYPTRHILGSVYDYLFKPGKEEPNYGLYSYVLIPASTARAESFFSHLFKTTSFVKLNKISTNNLNIIYLPTSYNQLSALIPKITDGSPPPLNLFTSQYYDYGLAQKILATICFNPSKVVRDLCGRDLSLGPYLVTTSHPISGQSSISLPYLFVDLSNVHVGAFGEFIAAYKEQVKRGDFTDLKRVDNLRLRILSIVLTSADWISPVRRALAENVYLAK